MHTDFSLFTGLVAVVLTLGIPIVVIVARAVMYILTKNRDTELRKYVIENHVDAESIKLLLGDQPKTNRTFAMLRWGSILLGGAAGYMVFSTADVKMQIAGVCIGMGVAMLVAFVIEMAMLKRQREREREANEQVVQKRREGGDERLYNQK